MKKYYCPHCLEFTWHNPQIHVCLECTPIKQQPRKRKFPNLRLISASLEEQATWFFQELDKITLNTKGPERWA